MLVVITALAFGFTNGFHHTGNAMATSIAAGAFLSLAVAATIASGLVDTKVVTLTAVAVGLTGGIIWNLLTWLFGILAGAGLSALFAECPGTRCQSDNAGIRTSGHRRPAVAGLGSCPASRRNETGLSQIRQEISGR
ncbi:MAG TPA: hypothetical protein VFW50_46170 [Streptosporangiaceae bacterium]|nr:hypothetical protein [Streptosporangiaceae bacterium]